MSLLLKNARLHGEKELVSLLIDNGIIEAIAPVIDAPNAEVIDCGGKLLLPSFVDCHTHLDKAFLETDREAEGLMDAVFMTADYQKSLDKSAIRADVIRRGGKVLDMELKNGSGLVRSHVTVDDIWGMEAFYGSVALKQAYAGKLDVQLTVPFNPAFVGEWEEAVRAGDIDFIAGYPTVTPDPKKTVDELFAVAEKYALPLDLHVDESDKADVSCFRYILEKTVRHGLQGKVNCSHVTALAAVDHATAEEAIALADKAQVSVIALPSCNMFLMGRADRGIVRRGITRITELEAAGVNVAIASDNIRDPFRPFGNGNLLEEGLLACQLLSRGTEAGMHSVIDMITKNARKTSHVDARGIEMGAKADLVLLDATSEKLALIENSTRLLVLKNGAIVGGKQA